jgi:phosphatidate cytidylyltransferase
MLRTRLWMGAVLIGLAVAALVFDRWLAPWYPFWLLTLLGLSLTACYELLRLVQGPRRPSACLCYVAVAALVAANWAAAVAPVFVWECVALAFAFTVLAAFLGEMAAFQEPGDAVNRMALAVWTVGYLGLLPCFLAQLRWLDDAGTPLGRSTVALLLAIFVPKMCDTGAYFTGRLLGRHKMSPRLSPGKTWEGAVGGVAFAVVTALLLSSLGPALSGWAAAIGFGLTVGVAGMLGDLAESLVKRDCEQKDASQIMPGFGGVLDVVDSIVFAAPVAYWWLR